MHEEMSPGHALRDIWTRLICDAHITILFGMSIGSYLITIEQPSSALFQQNDDRHCQRWLTVAHV